MNPVLIQFGPLAIRWYGLMMALAFLAGLMLARRRARYFAVDQDVISDALLWAMLGGIAGARILFVVHNWSYFAAQPLQIVMIHHGGLVFYGGFAGAIAAIWLLCRRRQLPVLHIADLLIPALPLGHALGRIGCFLNGCCYGRPWPHGVSYSSQFSDVLAVQLDKGLLSTGSAAALPVFPIQLLETVANLLIVAMLLLAEKRLPYRGQLTALYLLGYGGARFLLEFGRGDYPELVGGLLTPAQIICLGVILPIGAGLWRLARQRRQSAVLAAANTGGDGA